MIGLYRAKRKCNCGECGELIVKGEEIVKFGEYQYTHSFHKVCVLKVVCKSEVDAVVNRALVGQSA